MYRVIIVDDEPIIRRGLRETIEWDSLGLEVEPLPEKYAGIRVPPFIMQPIAENIFKHGIQNHCSDNLIQIETEKTEEGLTIRIRDNGEGVSPEALAALKKSLEAPAVTKGHYGLYNINRRLLLFRGGSGYLSVDSGEKRYFEVQIHLKAEEERA